jgi:hypothetical protein
MTDGKNERKNIGGETPTDARSSSAAPCGCGRRSTAVLAPRSLSSQGTQPQAMLPGTRPLRMTGFPRPCLSQSSDCTSRPSRSARGLMPKAARERVASPRAGTALARAIRLCLPGHVREGRGSMLYVTETVTYVNENETKYSRVSSKAFRVPVSRRRGQLDDESGRVETDFR